MKTIMNFLRESYRLGLNISFAILTCLFLIIITSCQKAEVCLIYEEALSSQDISESSNVADIDKNVYKTVKIGDQTWMAENLATTHYSDGTPIPFVTDNMEWNSLTTPGYCWYNNDLSYKTSYGALYNWYAVNTSKVCPSGWHVPSDQEWHKLALSIDPLAVYSNPLALESLIAGGKLKEPGTIHWMSPNAGATNETGFTGLPAGYHDYKRDGYYSVRVAGAWWANSEFNSSNALYRCLNCDSNSLVRDGDGENKKVGLSIRCLKD